MSAQITPRERVTAALNFEQADRVPIDFSSNHNTGVSIVGARGDLTGTIPSP